MWLIKPKIFFASHWLLYSFLFYNACNGSRALVAVCVRSLYLEAAHIPLRKVKISWERNHFQNMTVWTIEKNGPIQKVLGALVVFGLAIQSNTFGRCYLFSGRLCADWNRIWRLPKWSYEILRLRRWQSSKSMRRIEKCGG